MRARRCLSSYGSVIIVNRGNETTAPGVSVSRSIQTSRYKNHPSCSTSFCLTFSLPFSSLHRSVRSLVFLSPLCRASFFRSRWNRFSLELFAAATLFLSLFLLSNPLRPLPRVVLSPREIDCGLGTKLPGGTVYATMIDAPTPNASHAESRHCDALSSVAGPQSAATDHGDFARSAPVTESMHRPRARAQSCIVIHRRALPDLARLSRVLHLASVLHLVPNLEIRFLPRTGCSLLPPR